VGQSPPRVDGLEKVTGRATFLANLAAERMAHARLVRSTLPHAAIRGIQTQATSGAPGALAEPYWGPAVMDQSPLAIGRVRYVGEPVAAVVAESAERAEAAAALVGAGLRPAARRL
jgi:CO/xanthine dehydrogenase Mo-binding subunit